MFGEGRGSEGGRVKKGGEWGGKRTYLFKKRGEMRKGGEIQRETLQIDKEGGREF